jgi:cyclopropane fatty-acyl-phospholipid synthase-like methyltransferase
MCVTAGFASRCPSAVFAGGDSVHHGYWITNDESKEQAQVQLMDLLTEVGQVQSGSRVLDVGCGVGGTGRYLVQRKDCQVRGITLSEHQVETGRRLNEKAGVTEDQLHLSRLDAETIGSQDDLGLFDVVWICEALSHASRLSLSECALTLLQMPNKELVFKGAARRLKPGGRLV